MNATRIVREDQTDVQVAAVNGKEKRLHPGITPSRIDEVMSALNGLNVEHGYCEGLNGIEAVSSSEAFQNGTSIRNLDYGTLSGECIERLNSRRDGFNPGTYWGTGTIPYDWTHFTLNQEHNAALNMLMRGRGGPGVTCVVGASDGLTSYPQVATNGWSDADWASRVNINDYNARAIVSVAEKFPEKYELSPNSPTWLFIPGTTTPTVFEIEDIYETALSAQFEPLQHVQNLVGTLQPGHRWNAFTKWSAHWKVVHEMAPLMGSGPSQAPPTQAIMDLAFDAGELAGKHLFPVNVTENDQLVDTTGDGSGDTPLYRFLATAAGACAYDGTNGYPCLAATIANSQVQAFDVQNGDFWTPPYFDPSNADGFTGFDEHARAIKKVEARASLPLLSQFEAIPYQFYQHLPPTWTHEVHSSLVLSAPTGDLHGTEYQTGSEMVEVGGLNYMPFTEAIGCLKYSARRSWLVNRAIIGESAGPIFQPSIDYSYGGLGGGQSDGVVDYPLAYLSMDHDDFEEWVLGPMVEPITETEAQEFGLAEGAIYVPRNVFFWDATTAYMNALFMDVANGSPALNNARLNLAERMFREGGFPDAANAGTDLNYWDLDVTSTANQNVNWNANPTATSWWQQCAEYLDNFAIERYRRVQKVFTSARIRGAARASTLASLA